MLVCECDLLVITRKLESILFSFVLLGFHTEILAYAYNVFMWIFVVVVVFTFDVSSRQTMVKTFWLSSGYMFLRCLYFCFVGVELCACFVLLFFFLLSLCC